MKKESISTFVWGFAIGAIALLIVIFWAGWVETKGTAQAEAKQMAEKAVLDKLTPICVAQFLQDPNKEDLLKELKEKSSYQRGNYVKEKGWATMPGNKTPDSEIADECAKRILELKE
jgi:hypothetical protein